MTEIIPGRPGHRLRVDLIVDTARDLLVGAARLRAL